MMIDLSAMLAVFVIDDVVLLVAMYASIAASVAGAAYGAYASNEAAKQAEMNADAQAQAARLEQQRQNDLAQENARRQAIEDKRFRASQNAAISGMGIVSTVGSPLEVTVQTVVEQDRAMKDLFYERDMATRQLGYEAVSALAMGDAAARNHRMQAGATILNGLGSAAGSFNYGGQPKAKTTTGTV